MLVTIEATLRVPVTFQLDLDADTLGDISLGDPAAIEEDVREHLADAEGAGRGEIELTVMDKDMHCYFDSEIEL